MVALSIHNRQAALELSVPGDVDCLRCLTKLTNSIEQQVFNPSNGNQPQIVIAKWVARQPPILTPDEPTRGIDIGAWAEVHAQLSRLASERVAIIVVSYNLREALVVSGRIIVVEDGRSAGIIPRAEASQECIMERATG